MSTVVVIGATGQIGRVVVAEALAQGHAVRAQTRSASRARRVLPAGAEVVEAPPTDVEALRRLTDGADGVILTHGGDADGENAYYAVVPALLEALADSPATRVALMTSMNVSRPGGAYSFMDWKRRAERVLRASGRPYTIIRPGWFGYQDATDQAVELLQGDRVTSARGVDRRHVALALLAALTCPSALGRTVEVFSAPGPAVTGPDDLEPLFASTRPDDETGWGVDDERRVPLADEPARVREDITRLSR